MEDFSYNNISEENWTSLTSPMYKKSFDENVDMKEDYKDEMEANESVSNKIRVKVLSPIATLQLIVCLIVLIFSYLANAFYTDKFTAVKDAFDNELFASMFFDGKFKDIDYSEVLKLDE
ncbi:MAG: hypothetical protein E7566_00600 [Ruminococcaceae bacterium]|nr:hypothetical protein [Oscillospiraceae bacterium]